MRNIMMAAIALLIVCLYGCGSGGSSTSGSGGDTASHTVNFSAGANGSVTGATSQSVATGKASTAVTAVPAGGYHFFNWTGDAGFATCYDNPLTVTNISASQNIKANFRRNIGGVRLKLISSGLLSPGSSLSALRVKLQIPAGVTVSVDAGDVTNPGVVTASGVAANSSLNFVAYTPATVTTPATLEFLIVSNEAGGFGTGEFATVTCLLVSATIPSASDFILPAADFKPADLQLRPVQTLTAALTVTYLE